VLVVALALMPLAPGAASAADDGDWWNRQLGTVAANQRGADGAGVKVAVVDTAITTSLPMLEGVDLRVREPSFCVFSITSATPVPADAPRLTSNTSHGSNAVALVAGNGKGFAGGTSVRGVAPKATVSFYAIANSGSNEPFKRDCEGTASLGRAIGQAVADGADIISISIAAEASAGTSVHRAVAWALSQGVVVVAALRNDDPGQDSMARLNGVVAVAAHDSQGRLGSEEVEYGRVTVRAPGVGMLLQGNRDTGDWTATRTGQGTSYATPVVTGVLAAAWSKYPDATGNQMIQALIHAAGNGDGLEYDPRSGYGHVSLQRMLERDPTTYPDVNPLITPEPQFDGDLSAADIRNAPAPAWVEAETPSPSVSDPYPDPDQDQGLVAAPAPDPGPSLRAGVLLVGVLLVGLLVVTGVIVTVVVVVVRSQRRT